MPYSYLVLGSHLIACFDVYHIILLQSSKTILTFGSIFLLYLPFLCSMMHCVDVSLSQTIHSVSKAASILELRRPQAFLKTTLMVEGEMQTYRSKCI